MEKSNSLIKMPGYRISEYILLLNTNESLKEKIMKIKNEIHLNYQSSLLRNRKPVIRLAKFFSWEMMEEKITNHLKIAGMSMPPFKISLKDYGSFPTHTLFINVTSKIALQMLMKEIKTARKLMRSPENEPFFSNEFYIPLAIKLPPLTYDKIWNEYSHRQFTGSFIADNMLLLKKSKGEKNYQIAARFEFMNLPVSTKQGELFA